MKVLKISNEVIRKVIAALNQGEKEVTITKEDLILEGLGIVASYSAMNIIEKTLKKLPYLEVTRERGRLIIRKKEE